MSEHTAFGLMVGTFLLILLMPFWVMAIDEIMRVIERRKKQKNKKS